MLFAFERGMRTQVNVLTEEVIGAALEVHRELGPGLLENAYQTCLAIELLSRGFNLERQKVCRSFQGPEWTVATA
jgi:GxxExxY protein